MDSDARANVLMVDDRPENLATLDALLRDEGYQLVAAGSGREALKEVLHHDFAVILLDVRMPEMDGYETASLIRSRDRSSHTPIVFLTALDRSEADVARGYAVGAVDYLAKPFVPEVLKAKVSAFVEMWRKTNELRDEIDRRQRAEQEVRALNEDLERRILERTAELVQMNLDLANEITARRQAEAMRDDLTHMLIHDLRTPLTSVLAGLQTLQAMTELPEDEQEVLAIATEGAETLLGMINDLLDVARMETGGARLSLQEIDGRALVQRAARQVASLVQDKQLTLTSEIPDDIPLFSGDEEKLRRTLINLLGNAIRHTPPGGSIRIALHSEDAGGVKFMVQDTGEGIPREAFERIFEKFGQVGDRGGRMTTGLGLTFCKMVVEAHGGRIWVESEPGEGSTFYFTVPSEPSGSAGV